MWQSEKVGDRLRRKSLHYKKNREAEVLGLVDSVCAQFVELAAREAITTPNMIFTAKLKDLVSDDLKLTLVEQEKIARGIDKKLLDESVQFSFNVSEPDVTLAIMWS